MVIPKNKSVNKTDLSLYNNFAESIRTPQLLVNSISIEEDCILSSFPSFILDELRRRSIN